MLSIEQALKLVADYHSFCEDKKVIVQNTMGKDELSEDELDFIYAAAADGNKVIKTDRYKEKKKL